MANAFVLIVSSNEIRTECDRFQTRAETQKQRKLEPLKDFIIRKFIYLLFPFLFSFFVLPVSLETVWACYICKPKVALSYKTTSKTDDSTEDGYVGSNM